MPPCYSDGRVTCDLVDRVYEGGRAVCNSLVVNQISPSYDTAY